MSTWKVVALNAYPKSKGQENVVFTIHWRAELSQDDEIASSYGSVPSTYVAGDPFIEFVDLTEDQVISWAKESLGEEQVAEIEANLVSQLKSLLNPISISPALPWG
jgi:hypothetical protein